MELEIKIEEKDLGATPKEVRSLLGKCKPLWKRHLFKKDDTIKIYLLFPEAAQSELSLTIIWRLLKSCSALPCEVMIFYRSGSKESFDEHHFFDSLSGRKSSIFSKAVPVHYETFVPIRPRQGDTRNEEINNIFMQVTKDVLKVGNEFHGEIKAHILECIQNAHDHSESSPDTPAGIVCSLKDSGYIDFCVADMGQGIRRSFLANPLLGNEFSSLADTELLRKATSKGISCNPTHARNPAYSSPNAGIGLYYLKEFVRLHPGSRLVIISGNGYYQAEYGRTPRTVGTDRWPGTVVYFRTKLDQQKSAAYTSLIGEFLEEFDARTPIQ